MSIGNGAVRRAFAGCMVLFLACRAEERSTQLPSDTPTSAWWVNVSFTPTSTTVRGIDVRTIDPQWQRAEALDTVKIRSRVSADDAGGPRAEPARTELVDTHVEMELQLLVEGAVDALFARWEAKEGAVAPLVARHGAPTRA